MSTDRHHCPIAQDNLLLVPTAPILHLLRKTRSLDPNRFHQAGHGAFLIGSAEHQPFQLGQRDQRDRQDRIVVDASRTPDDRAKAKRLRQEAESQLELLTQSENLIQADFYSYRYFASEGFLPGYSFPRLPLSAFIPGRKGSRRASEDFVQRLEDRVIDRHHRQSVGDGGSRIEVGALTSFFPHKLA